MGMRMVKAEAGWLTLEQQPPNMKASMTTTAIRDGPVWRTICTGTALGLRASPSATAFPLPSRCRELPILAGEFRALRSQGCGLELSCRKQRDTGARAIDPRQEPGINMSTREMSAQSAVVFCDRLEFVQDSQVGRL